MEIVHFLYILGIAVAIGGGWLAGGLRSIQLHRRCTKLEYLVGDIEDRLNSVRGKEAAKARWKQKEWDDEALKALEGRDVKPQRYDNDPVA